VQDHASAGNDGPFWDSLNVNVKNLHALISGHGLLSYNPLLSSCLIDLLLKITASNGVPGN